jgi:hypothetical protein
LLAPLKKGDLALPKYSQDSCLDILALMSELNPASELPARAANKKLVMNNIFLNERPNA